MKSSFPKIISLTLIALLAGSLASYAAGKGASAKAPTVRMASATAQQLGVAAGANVKLKQGSGEAVLPVQIEECVPVGCVRVVAATAATAALGDLFGQISVERA